MVRPQPLLLKIVYLTNLDLPDHVLRLIALWRLDCSQAVSSTLSDDERHRKSYNKSRKTSRVGLSRIAAGTLPDCQSCDVMRPEAQIPQRNSASAMQFIVVRLLFITVILPTPVYKINMSGLVYGRIYLFSRSLTVWQPCLFRADILQDFSGFTNSLCMRVTPSCFALFVDYISCIYPDV